MLTFLAGSGGGVGYKLDFMLRGEWGLVGDREAGGCCISSVVALERCGEVVV